MPNYGFAIDLRKCIGCHACTIACKAEHQIPVGVNRCWVKTVEKGTFPETRRLFFPALCNQCDSAPCVRICPTRALFKRPDRVVDLNPAACIGCRACMVACPYDQLFIDPNTHTAEKCNFCANRIENELLPACVSVCPTGCRIFGDLDDPASEVSRIAGHKAIAVRKPEKGTIPKVLYIGAEESTIRPEAAARPFMYKEGQVILRPAGAPEPDPSDPGEPRVDYDTPHAKPWGLHMATYLLTKGIATGLLLIAACVWLAGAGDVPLFRWIAPAFSLGFITLTAAVLVHDLERPERFYYILTRPNRRSWMAWGGYFMTAHGAVSFGWLVAAWFGANGLLWWLALAAVLISLATTAYTGFLFAQGLGRDLWQGPHATLDLLAQAIVEGAAILLIALTLRNELVGDPHRLFGPEIPLIFAVMFAPLVRGVFLLAEYVLIPSPTRHHELATRTIVAGPYKVTFWLGAVGLGCGSSLLLILAPAAGIAIPRIVMGVVVPALLLGGSFAWEYVWVEAGQSVPLS